MLHTWKNAAYLGDLNFGKTFGKTFGEKFGKSENDLVFLENDRSFARLSERSCHEPRLMDFDTCWKHNTLYSGIKIVVQKYKTLEVFYSIFFQKFPNFFPNFLKISKEFGKKFGKKW
jgi:hypothetical protein